MAKPKKRRVEGGRVTPSRVTPKGTTHQQKTTPDTVRPPAQNPSPMWVPVLMFALLGLGMVMIFFNYVGWLPGGTDNWWLLGGLALILGGIVTATQFR